MQRRGHHQGNNNNNNNGGWGGGSSDSGWSSGNNNNWNASSNSGWSNDNSWTTTNTAQPPTPTNNNSSWNNNNNNWNNSPSPVRQPRNDNTRKVSNAPPPPPPPPPTASKKQEQPTTQNPWIAPDLTEAANVIAPGMASNPLAQMAASSIAQYGNSTISRYIPGVVVFWNAMRHHFNVDNNYVKKKLGLLLFPKQNSWKRMTIGGPSHDSAPLQADGVASNAPKKAYLPPTQDVNAPDLYIPTMAFTTYVVMIGLLKGTVGEFTPDVLSQVMMSSLFMECLQVRYFVCATKNVRASRTQNTHTHTHKYRYS